MDTPLVGTADLDGLSCTRLDPRSQLSMTAALCHHHHRTDRKTLGAARALPLLLCLLPNHFRDWPVDPEAHLTIHFHRSEDTADLFPTEFFVTGSGDSLKLLRQSMGYGSERAVCWPKRLILPTQPSAGRATLTCNNRCIIPGIMILVVAGKCSARAHTELFDIR